MDATENKETESPLILLSGGEELKIPECDGTLMIASATEIFQTIHADFDLFGFHHPNKATQESTVNVYAINRVCKYNDMSEFLQIRIKSLCFTQHQIITFVVTHPDWLAIKGVNNFFFFRRGGDVCVAKVHVAQNEKMPKIDLERDLSIDISSHNIVVQPAAVGHYGQPAIQPANVQSTTSPLNFARLIIPSTDNSLIGNLPV